jgi:hypothetical protein
MVAARDRPLHPRHPLEAHAEPDPVMARRIAIAVVVVAVLLFLPPFINLKRYQPRITQSLSGAIGRKVSFSAVHLRVLPQPGFTFSNFVIAEDPAFGLEPMLRADEVTASVRLTSLWRGRLEIAKLSFDTPSLNLTRDERGLWNFGGSLRQAANVPAAPTSEKRTQAAPRFPYIEASDARVNFKFGQTKQAFALIETDFSLWLASENHWEMRLEARPMRTDASLGDTGTLRAEASIVRPHNETIEDLPLKASVRWENAQLGQLTWLLTGADRGWRGDVDLRGDIEGTPRVMRVRGRASLDGFRRYDIATTESLRGTVACSAELARQAGTAPLHFTADSLQCELPVGKGRIALTGSASWADQQYDVAFAAAELPLESLVSFYRRAKLNVSDDLRASGTLSGDLHVKSDTPCIAGDLRLKDVKLTDSSRGVDLPVGAVAITSASSQRPRIAPSPVCLTSTPIPLALGGKNPVLLKIEWAQKNFTVALNGPAESDRLLAAVKSFGLIARDYHAQGVLDVNARLVIEPQGFAHPLWAGTVSTPQLALPQGITLRNVALDFLGEQVSLRQFTAALPDVDTTVSGSMRWPVRCGAPPCDLNFTLRATTVDIDALNRAFNPSFRKRNWLYLPRFFGGREAQESPMSLLLAFKGSGTLQADRLIARRASVENFGADVTWADQRLALANVHGRTLGGELSGNVKIDFAPSLTTAGRLAVTNADAAASATIVGVPWAQGRGTFSADFSFEGAERSRIADTFRANLHFALQNGALRRLGARGDLPFRSWVGDGEVSARTLKLTSTLRAGNGAFDLAGTVGSDLHLDLKVSSPSSVTSISGTLAAPQVTTSTTTTYSASNPQDAISAPAKKRD